MRESKPQPRVKPQPRILSFLGWVGAVLGLVLVVAAVFYYRWANEHAFQNECRHRYAKALTAADTTTVDGYMLESTNPKVQNQQLSCGELRKLGRLH